MIAKSCLVGSLGAPVAQTLCRNLKAAIGRYAAYAGDHVDLLKALFEVQPIAMLDELAVGSEQDRQRSIVIMRDATRHRPNPLGSTPDDMIMAWCAVDPDLRYPFAAAVVPLFGRSKKEQPHEWRPIAESLLRCAPDPVIVFKQISGRIWPTSFSGSMASKLESRLQLLERLDIGNDPALVSAFNEAHTKLAAWANNSRKAELEEDRAQSGRFE
jgi:hypothetical protein